MKKSSSRRGKAKDGDDTVAESLREDGSFRSEDEGEVDRFASLLNPSDYSADGIDESQGLLSGEKVLKTAEGEVVVRQEGGGDLPRKGTLHFTNYRLFLSQEAADRKYWIPYNLILRWKASLDKDLGAHIVVDCKDFRSVALHFSRGDDQQLALKALKAHFACTSVREFYAFQNNERYPIASELAGWPIYTLERELERQGVGFREKNEWKLIENSQYKKSPTYPSKLLIPRSMNKAKLYKSDIFYAKRMIAFSWKNPGGEGMIFRYTANVGSHMCRDTHGGLTGHKPDRHTEGEFKEPILKHILKLYPKTTNLHILAVCPLAGLTRQSGDVFEPRERIKVHVASMMNRMEVNNSLLRLIEYTKQFYPQWKRYSSPGASLDTMTIEMAEDLKETKWLSCVKQLLRVTKIATSVLLTNEPLVVRGVAKNIYEQQITSLAQLCLDPYYRTMKGFSVLVEKEWLSFGHKFWQRPTKKKASASRNAKQLCGTFLLWLDAVFQLWDLRPQAFEFTADYLSVLMDAVYSSRFGTFLANSEKQKNDENFYTGSVSVWSFLDVYKQGYMNPVYDDSAFPLGKSLPIKPKFAKLWTSYYLRWEGQKAEMRSGAKIIDFCAREGFRPDDMKDEELDLNMSNSELHALPVALMRQIAPSAGHSRFMKSTRGELQPEQWGPSGGIDRHLWRLKDLRALWLDHNFISSLGLLDCERIKRLQVLDLSHNQLKAFSAKNPIIRSLFILTDLRELNLRGNRIDRLPQEVSQLTNLTLLDLSDNRLEEIPSSLISLSGSLRHLFLGHNRTLENFDFPSSINYLTNLRRLDVQGNNFHSLPMSLFEKLVHLEELSLSENYFAALPPCAPHGLSALHKLDLSRLRLNDFSFPQQVIMTTLRELRAVDLALTTLPSTFSTLQALEYLDLSDNLLLSVPGSLMQLASLKFLYLRNNKLTALPPHVSQLKSLVTLDVGLNQIAALPIQVGSLKNLTSLDFSYNAVRELPPQLAILPLLTHLNYEGNEIVYPQPPILVMGQDAVLRFMRQLIDGQEQCSRMKLMLVGQENVGKSTLLRALRHHSSPKVGKAPRKMMSDSLDKSQQGTNISTDGIDISQWVLPVRMPADDGAPAEVKEVTLSAWDFAGQEIYYSTHQFFLSERSLYLFVFDVSQPNMEQSSRIEFWLRSIRARAKNASVIVVGTHIDEKICTNNYLELRRHYVEEFCASRYPNIRGITFVSCTTGKGLDVLQAMIEETIVAQGHIGDVLPKSYLHLESLILNHKTKGKRTSSIAHQPALLPPLPHQPHQPQAPGSGGPHDKSPPNGVQVPIISYEEYKSIAQLCLIENKELEIATTLLHNLGSIIYFGDDEKLADVVILDPQWLTNVMSSIVTTKHSYVSRREGILHHSTLPLLWREPDFPASLHAFILALLNRFEIAFTMDNVHTRGAGPDSDDKALARKSRNETKPNDDADDAAESQITAGARIDYNGVSLIPCLLSEERPKDMDTLWPRRRRGDGISEFGRVYRFNFVPAGFFGRVMVRLLNFKLEKAKKYWRNGLLLHNHPEKVLVEFLPSSNQLNITIRTVSDDDQSSSDSEEDPVERARNARDRLSRRFDLHKQRKESFQTLSLLVFAAVDALINDWYSLDVRVLVPCAHCVDNEIYPPYYFPFQDCQSALFKSSSAYATCLRDAPAPVLAEAAPDTPRRKVNYVRLDKLVPDVAMVHLQASRIKFTELQLANLVGKGSFAEVYRAIWRKPKKKKRKEKNEDDAEDSELDDFSEMEESDTETETETETDTETDTEDEAAQLKGKPEDYEEETVAVKKLMFTEEEDLPPEDTVRAIEEFRNEVWIMSGVVHPNIVPLKGFTMEPCCCIVTEFMEGGNLWDFIKSEASETALTWPLRLKIAKDVAKGMAFLHSMNPPIMHRDLKTPNIMLADISPQSKVVAKVIDFGVSSSALSAVGRKVDCPVWLAPEIIRGKDYSVKSDVYSFGVILYELLVRHRYFAEDLWMSKLETKIIGGVRPALPDECLPEYRELIVECWQPDASKRPSFKQVLAKLQAALARHYPLDAAYDAGEVEGEVDAVPDDQKQTPTKPEPPSIDPPAPTEPLVVVSTPEPEPPSIDPPAPQDGIVTDVAPAEQSATQSGEPVLGVDSVATDAPSLRHEALLPAAAEQRSAHDRAGKRRSQHEARMSCQIKRRSARYSCSVQRRKAKEEDEAERYLQNIRLDNLAAKFTQWQSRVRSCKRTAVELSHSPKPEAGPGPQAQPQPQSPVAATAASAPIATVTAKVADENGGEDALGRRSSEARRRLTMGEKGNGGAEDQLPRPQVPSPASPRAKKSEATTAASCEEAEERSHGESLSGEPAKMEMKFVVKAEVVVKERRKDMEWKEGNIARKPSREMPAIVVVSDETTPRATSEVEQPLPQPSLEQAADQSAERGSISETSDSRTSVSYGDYDDEGSSLRTEESEDDDSDIFEMEEVESPRTELMTPRSASCAALSSSSSSSSYLSPSEPPSLSTSSTSAAAEDDERLRRKLREIEERRQRVHELVKKREKAASAERLGVAAGGASGGSPARQGKRIKRRSQSAEDLAQRREREQMEKEQRALRRAEARAREMLERQQLLQQLAGQTKSATHGNDGDNESDSESENDHGSEDESETNVKKANKKGEKTKTRPQEEEKDEDEEAVPQRRFGHRKQLSFGVGFGPRSLERVHSWTKASPVGSHRGSLPSTPEPEGGSPAQRGSVSES